MQSDSVPRTRFLSSGPKSTMCNARGGARWRSAALCALLSTLLLAPAAAQRAQPTRAWDAEIQTPGGPLRFQFEFASDPAQGAWILSAGQRVALEPRPGTERTLVLEVPPYDARIELEFAAAGDALNGTWIRGARGEPIELPLSARRASAAPAAAAPAAPAAAQESAHEPALAPRWRVRFAAHERLVIGDFSVDATGAARGTLRTSMGDYRWLAGHWRAGELELGCFDGARAHLLRARLGEDGALRGDFWSGSRSHDTFEAHADAQLALPDAFELTPLEPGLLAEELAYLDARGELAWLADPRHAGRARVLWLFGSWCPNCNDEARDLAGLLARHAARGLSVLGLGFESDAPREQQLARMASFAQRHALELPLLLAGPADKPLAARAMPLVRELHAWPTTIFLNAQGEVRATHTGYAGPATGTEHELQLERFEAEIERLLAEAADGARSATPVAPEELAAHPGASSLELATRPTASVLELAARWLCAHEWIEVGAATPRTLRFELRADVQGAAELLSASFEGLGPAAARVRKHEAGAELCAASVRVGGELYVLDRAARVLRDPGSLAHRFVPRGHSPTPQLDLRGLRHNHALPEAIEHAEWVLRREAAIALADPTAPWLHAHAPRALELARDADARVRAAAALALGARQPEGALDALLAAALDRSPAVRREALRALLARWPAQAAVRARLAELASDPDPLVRALLAPAPGAPGASAASAER
jgi:peroxiredoxin